MPRSKNYYEILGVDSKADLSVVKNFSINPEYIQNKLSFVSANKEFLTKNSKNKTKNLNTAKKID